MNKKILYTFCCLFILIIIFGWYDWNKKIEAIGAEAFEKAKKEEIEAQKTAEKSWLGEVNPSVVLIGSSVTRGKGASSTDKSWAGLLESHFLETNPKLKFLNLGTDGFTTEDVLNNTLNKAISEKPNVIIFEVCTINDYNNLALEDSKSNIDKIADTIKREIPKTRLVLTLPSIPISTQMNNDGVLFREYATDIENHIKSKNWQYVEFWDDLERLYSEKSLSLNDVVADGVHPNDLGYSIWFEVTKGDFTK